MPRPYFLLCYCIVLLSCNSKDENDPVPEPEPDPRAWVLTHIQDLSYSHNPGEFRYISKKGFYYDYDTRTIYVRDTLKDGPLDARIDRYKYFYDDKGRLRQWRDTIITYTSPRDISINYNSNDQPELVHYTAEPPVGGTARLLWSNYGNGSKVVWESGYYGPFFNAAKYVLNQQNKLVAYGEVYPAPFPYPDENIFIRDASQNITCMKRYDYNTGRKLFITDSTIFTSNPSNPRSLSEFYNMLTYGVSWWTLEYAIAGAPIVALDIPTWIYDNAPIEKAVHYHDYDDGAGLIKIAEITYQYEMDNNGRLSRLLVKDGEKKKCELSFAWKEIKWKDVTK